ncbi:hypothetical protein EIP91_000778 [Steccherinum ochraceum]|uniref:GTP-binding protein 2 n=1 Tax=Steccherinum ochraceum TaxID=92696 RepID=A0A4R0RF34_9APHY|nr:hypothetical protein EIP91_000778 [Steccherinum ochraceum]
MFGEHESESPRVPSPWDPFLPSPPSEASSLGSTRFSGIPKLVPEVEEGNVEYKLKLTNISPARFDRLVTQLKWRLLEGGGQAYYELGVADSGALIGLTRNDLEQSLETLEMMAGEIGASVIVVKEIEVPPLMVALADKLSGYLDPETGEWADKMLSRRPRAVLTSEDNLSTTPGTTTEPDTEASTAESTDYEDDNITSWSTPAGSPRASPCPGVVSLAHRASVSNPSRPLAQSSPFITPFDDDLALFSMEPEPNVDEDELNLDPAPTVEVDGSGISVDLEIASVYKPRPVRKRAPITSIHPAPGQGKRGQKSKDKKHQPWHTAPRALLAPSDTAQPITDVIPDSTTGKETKAVLRRQARDKRRQEKHQVFLASLTGNTSALPSQSLSVVESDGTKELVHGLEHMHVTVQSAPPPASASTPPVQAKIDGVDDNLAALTRAADKLVQLGPSVDALLGEEPLAAASKEPRLIVEALVVRKLSLDEAYLDFDGF